MPTDESPRPKLAFDVDLVFVKDAVRRQLGRQGYTVEDVELLPVRGDALRIVALATVAKAEGAKEVA